MADTSFDPYGGLNYSSYPYYHSHPDRLFTLGKFFGASPAEPGTASVLEIGCSSGGNLIPIALKYPQSKLLGIDSSLSQVNAAQKSASEIGLMNVTFENKFVSELQNIQDQFDYIVIHNVISWVNEQTRNEIFDLCKKLLKPTGIAFVSYNVHAGHSTANLLREMVLYNTHRLETIPDKLEQAKAFLAFTINALEESENPLHQMIYVEARALFENDNMLCDYLIGDHKVFSFHEFFDELDKRELQYISDTYLPSMYIGNAPTNILDALKQLSDIVDVEEYLDFFTQKAFKSSIICHKDVKIKRDVSEADLSSFYISSNILLEVPSKDITNFDDINQSLSFLIKPGGGGGIQTNSSVMKAVLYTIADNAAINPMSFTQIIDSASEKLPNVTKEEIQTTFNQEVVGLIFTGYIDITNYATKASTVLSDKPKIYHLARYQALQSEEMWVTNLRGQIVFIGLFEKYAFRYMDGEYGLDAIEDFLLNHAQQEDLSFSKDGQPITNKDELKQEIKDHLQDSLNFALEMCLLTP